MLLADPRPPMQLTSARSTEAYRTFWNDAAMRRFMRASLTGMQRLDGRRRGARAGAWNWRTLTRCAPQRAAAN